MITFEKDMQMVARTISNEIREIDRQMEDNNLNDYVEHELELLINEYQQQLESAKLDVNTLRIQYQTRLRNTRIRALKKARERLEDLEGNISSAISWEQGYGDDLNTSPSS